MSIWHITQYLDEVHLTVERRTDRQREREREGGVREKEGEERVRMGERAGGGREREREKERKSMFVYKCVDSTIKRPNLLVRKSDTACITQHGFLLRNNSISLYTLYINFRSNAFSLRL